MQRLTIVRYTSKPEAAEENAALSRRVFEEVRGTAPDDIGYALFRAGNEFTHVFMNLAEDNSDAVTDIPSFHAFQADLLARCDVPPQADRNSVELIDSYGVAGR